MAYLFKRKDPAIMQPSALAVMAQPTLSIHFIWHPADMASHLILAPTPFGTVKLSPDTRLEGWDGCRLPLQR